MELTRIYRKDYKKPSFVVDTVDLSVDLVTINHAEVRAVLHCRKNAVPGALNTSDFFLNGRDIAELKEIKIDGVVLPKDSYRLANDGLVILDAPKVFVLETLLRIDPANNTALSGLYVDGGGMFCTQMEAEGFRRFTYFPDRPDVLAVYSCRISADKAAYPVLLSNGNLVDSGDLPGGRHFASWKDPFPKPCYLFAMVAGDLGILEDTYHTGSGRKVDLAIYTQKKNLPRVVWAMDCLKRAMRWDEEAFGREYDLDRFMIVATDYFNFGAMENKGLNIFNASALLATAETATDDRFKRIEGIVAHEYFHNWSGDRVTCRSWFELSLKEGFTVLRDQLFSESMGDVEVERIQHVETLRALQFPEDSGPMAHPIRPDSFVTIENFYTTTVYEKGAEVIRMMRTMAGPEAFRNGTDLYFKRFDGQAVSCDDFIDAIAEGSGLDLTQFRRWYSQAGTPEVRIRVTRGPDHALTLEVEQFGPPTLGQPEKLPFHIPVKTGLLVKDGAVWKDVPLVVKDGARFDADTGVLHINEAKQRITLEKVPEGAVLSFLRGFSAPIKLSVEGRTLDDLSIIARFDPDGFARHEAVQDLALRALRSLVDGGSPDGVEVQAWLQACNDVLQQALTQKITPAFAAAMLVLPGESWLREVLPAPLNLDAIQKAYESILNKAATALDSWKTLYDTMENDGQYRPDTEANGRRALRGKALAMLARAGDQRIAASHFRAAKEMTSTVAALRVLCDITGGPAMNEALETYRRKNAADELLLDTWRAFLSGGRLSGGIERVRALISAPDFDWKRPNTVRGVSSSFRGSGTDNFDRADGAGYALYADIIIRLDASNPQTAAGITKGFGNWRKLDQNRQDLIQGELQRILSERGTAISTNTREVIEASLR